MFGKTIFKKGAIIIEHYYTSASDKKFVLILVDKLSKG